MYVFMDYSVGSTSEHNFCHGAEIPLPNFHDERQVRTGFAGYFIEMVYSYTLHSRDNYTRFGSNRRLAGLVISVRRWRTVSLSHLAGPDPGIIHRHKRSGIFMIFIIYIDKLFSDCYTAQL